MLFELGPYRVQIDVTKTKEFYEGAKAVSYVCSCDGCRNFEVAVDGLPAPITEFFSDLGIDMRKVCECYVNCVEDDGTLLYGGFYHVCGVLLEGKSAWRKIDESVSCWDDEAAFCVTPDFHISLQEEIALLEKDFPLPALQLEFSARIPWVLGKNNPYR